MQNAEDEASVMNYQMAWRICKRAMKALPARFDAQLLIPGTPTKDAITHVTSA